eukprot:GHUV01036043.1.p2 GENE.GHUV01036043.1~~GHUV01036043.1.p2  ORF type:complete len:107 (+),score=11.20 GHUV01036043.1:127-447(+)
MLAKTGKHALQARTAGCGAQRPLPLVSRVQRCVIADASLKETAFVAVIENGEFVKFPEEPAVYAVYNQDQEVQYIGLTRKAAASARCIELTGVITEEPMLHLSVVP